MAGKKAGLNRIMPVDPSKLVIDGERGMLFFKRGCLESLSFCKAFCCKKRWAVNISREEFGSGSYKAEMFCKTSGDECNNEAADCLYKGYRLKKGPKGHCIYLANDNRCSIHKMRPGVCRDFRCEDGWSLERNPPAAPPADEKRLFFVDDRTKKNFAKSVTGDMLFVLDPSQKPKTMVYLKEKKKLVIFHKPVDRCGMSVKQYKFHNPSLDDQGLLYLVNLFDGKRHFSDILKKINRKHAPGLVMSGLYEIACLFYYNGIIVPKCPR